MGLPYRRLATAATLALAAAAGAVALPPAASAAPTCSTTWCDKTDPHVTGCDATARTVGSVYIESNGIILGLTELRWSTACQTNWTRVTALVSSFDEIKAKTDRAKPGLWTDYQVQDGGGYGSSVYTDQLFGGWGFTVCGNAWIIIHGVEYGGEEVCA